jgi:hypothetical protein
MFGSRMTSSGGKPTRSVSEHAVGAREDGDAALVSVGLAALVERHDDHRGAVAADPPRPLDERLLALLEADGIDDALALEAFESRLDHLPLRGVDHHRDPADVGLGGGEVQERAHRRGGVQQRLVHVDVDHLRAVLHLLARDLERRLEVAALDQLGEAGGAGDVGPLSHVHEQRVRTDGERLETREPGVRRDLRDRAGG